MKFTSILLKTPRRNMYTYGFIIIGLGAKLGQKSWKQLSSLLFRYYHYRHHHSNSSIKMICFRFGKISVVPSDLQSYKPHRFGRRKKNDILSQPRDLNTIFFLEFILIVYVSAEWCLSNVLVYGHRAKAQEFCLHSPEINWPKSWHKIYNEKKSQHSYLLRTYNNGVIVLYS